MTLAFGTVPLLVFGERAAVPVTISGPSPVHAVLIDFIGDGQPAWYFVPFDARATVQYQIGPFRRRGRFELIAHAVDMMGCEISNGVRIFATIQ